MRKFFSALLAVVAVFVLVGCGSTPNSVENPTLSTSGNWSEQWVKVSTGDTILCLWNRKGTRVATMDCDWEHPNTMPEGTVPADTKYDTWYEEYVKMSTGETVLCLWKDRNTNRAVRSCDWTK